MSLRTFTARVISVTPSGSETTTLGGIPTYSSYVCTGETPFGNQDAIRFTAPPEVAARLVGKLVRVTIDPEDEVPA